MLQHIFSLFFFILFASFWLAVYTHSYQDRNYKAEKNVLMSRHTFYFYIFYFLHFFLVENLFFSWILFFADRLMDTFNI